MRPENALNESIFECTQCGECCTGYGGTYITDEDVRRIADFVGLSREAFLSTYCQIADGGMPVIAVGDGGKCVFFKENCSIHPVKPRMCRAWPFIDAVVKSPSNWELMAGACPGIRVGAPLSHVQKVVKEEMAKLDAARGEAGSVSPHLQGAKKG